MWYMNDYFITDYSALQFLKDVIRLFSDTLSEIMRVPIFGFFLAFSLLAVAYALVRYVYYVSKSGV